MDGDVSSTAACVNDNTTNNASHAWWRETRRPAITPALAIRPYLT
jgi:hypothetical protein